MDKKHWFPGGGAAILYIPGSRVDQNSSRPTFDNIFRVMVDNVAKVAEIELAEKEKMKDKVN